MGGAVQPAPSSKTERYFSPSGSARRVPPGRIEPLQHEVPPLRVRASLVPGFRLGLERESGVNPELPRSGK